MPLTPRNAPFSKRSERTEDTQRSLSAHPAEPYFDWGCRAGGGGPPIQSFTGRDPFSVPPALSPSPSPTTPGGGVSPSPSDGGGGGSQTPSPTAPGNGSSQNVGGSTVVLLDIFERDGATHVQVEVDGTVYDVVVGEEFAGGRFELRSVGGSCATFLFGDEQFTLCISAQK